MKKSGEQYDERIVEVTWDSNKQSWRFMRFRDDKHDGNHHTVIQNIVESILDGVEVEEVSQYPIFRPFIYGVES